MAPLIDAHCNQPVKAPPSMPVYPHSFLPATAPVFHDFFIHCHDFFHAGLNPCHPIPEGVGNLKRHQLPLPARPTVKEPVGIVQH
jgi:hypothetical protein